MPTSHRLPRLYADRKRLAASALILLLTGAACTDSVGPEAEEQDWIIFLSSRQIEQDSPTLDRDVYVTNADGTDPQNLTDRPAQHSDLQLSPDGTRLAFVTDLVTCQHVWVMNADGTGLTQLTGLSSEERCSRGPRWSPDGTTIAYHSADLQLGWEVYTMNPDGTGKTNVTGNPSSDFATSRDLVHGWTPDGRLVIHSTRDSVPSAYLMNAAGTFEPLFDSLGYETPYWSPDGASVAVVTVQDGQGDVWVFNADGTGGVNLTNTPDAYEHFSHFSGQPWSPNGSRLAIQRVVEGKQRIFVVDVDGAGNAAITSGASGHEDFNAWSPDGSQVLFTATADGKDIYIAPVDGSAPINLTDGEGEDWNPVWQRRDQ